MYRYLNFQWTSLQIGCLKQAPNRATWFAYPQAFAQYMKNNRLCSMNKLSHLFNMVIFCLWGRTYYSLISQSVINLPFAPHVGRFKTNRTQLSLVLLQYFFTVHIFNLNILKIKFIAYCWSHYLLLYVLAMFNKDRKIKILFNFK